MKQNKPSNKHTSIQAAPVPAWNCPHWLLQIPVPPSAEPCSCSAQTMASNRKLSRDRPGLCFQEKHNFWAHIHLKSSPSFKDIRSLFCQFYCMRKKKKRIP